MSEPVEVGQIWQRKPPLKQRLRVRRVWIAGPGLIPTEPELTGQTVVALAPCNGGREIISTIPELLERCILREAGGRTPMPDTPAPEQEEPMDEKDPTEGLPPDLVRVLRDPSIIVPQDAAVWELLAKWRNAPSNTASAEPYICSECGHGLVLHERDEDWQRAACCVDGCKCGHSSEVPDGS